MDIVSTAIYCKNHQKHQINFVNVSDNVNLELMCEECLSESSSSLKDFLSIQTIRVCDQDHIFNNWPPVNNPQLLKDIQLIIKQENLMIEQVDQQFSEMISQIVNKIQQIKKNLILHLEKQNQQKNEILKCYNQLSGKEQLKELINFKKQNIENQVKDLRQYVLICQNQKDQHTALLEEQLQKFNNLQINQDFITFIKQSSLKLIDNFDEQIFEKIKSDLIDSIKQRGQQVHQLFGKSNFCNFEESNQIQILENINENKISIIKNEQIQIGQVYFQHQLNKQKSYIFRFKFNEEIGSFLIIGLIDENYLDKQLCSTRQGKIFGINDFTFGGKAIKGENFFQTKKDQVIEMRIDIQNQQQQFLDYPNYQNINEPDEEFKLNQDTNYFLAIEFIQCSSLFQACLDLIYFEEIEK
ncbi:hypothetical protein ABPG74_020661 [Tetrahymena malaccensis]